jgi:hypothetical protein
VKVIGSLLYLAAGTRPDTLMQHLPQLDSMAAQQSGIGHVYSMYCCIWMGLLGSACHMVNAVEFKLLCMQALPLKGTILSTDWVVIVYAGATIVSIYGYMRQP